MSGPIRVITIVAATGAGVMAGFYLVFSAMVMPALGKMPADRALSAMQAINRTAAAPWMVIGLVVTGGASAVVAVDAVADLDASHARWRLVAAVFYLTTVALTVVFHVPRNVALDGADPTSSGAAEAWARYAPSWAAGNHARVLLSAAAAALFAAAVSLDAG